MQAVAAAAGVDGEKITLVARAPCVRRTRERALYSSASVHTHTHMYTCRADDDYSFAEFTPSSRCEFKVTNLFVDFLAVARFARDLINISPCSLYG